MMRVAGRLAALAAALPLAVAGGSALLPARAAHAVQTSTWGIVAAPDGATYRPTMTHPADGTTVHEAVLVWNRTDQPLSVDLSVLATSRANGTFQYSSVLAGLSAHITLAATSVTLAPHAQARVPVTIVEPRGIPTSGTELAAVAGESAPLHHGSLFVQERLVVLVEATATASLVPKIGPHDVGLWGSLALLLILLALLLWWLEHRRRRDRRLQAQAAAGVAQVGGDDLSDRMPVGASLR